MQVNKELVDMVNKLLSESLNGIRQISGFVFNYNEDLVNVSLFNNFLGIDAYNFTSAKEFKNAANSSLDEIVDLYQNKKKIIISNLKNNKNSHLNTLFKGNLGKLDVLLLNLNYYISIEVDKIIFFDDKLSVSEKKLIINKIEKNEEKIFGKKIINSSYILEFAINSLRYKYEVNGKKLNKDEFNIYNKTINNFPGIKFRNPIQNQEVLKDRLKDHKILDKLIHRRDYVKVFKLVIEFLGFDYKVVVKKNIKNISLSSISLNIPEVKQYEYLSIRKIIEMISHELETHALINQNSLRLIGDFRSLGYVEREEGTAYIFGKITEGYDLGEIPINRHFLRILGAELYGGNDYKIFLSMMNKFDGENINIDNFFVRYKRGKAFDLPGANPKDKLYETGAQKIKSTIRNKNNVLQYFLAKTTFKEQEIINELVRGLNGCNVDVKSLYKKGFKIPLFIGELIKYILAENIDRNTSDSQLKFYEYIYEKYHFMFKGIGLNYRDFMNLYQNIYTQDQEKKVKEIIKIIN